MNTLNVNTPDANPKILPVARPARRAPLRRAVLATAVTAALASGAVWGQLEDLGTLGGGTSSQSHGVSADGSVVVVVGESGSTEGTRAFRWTAGGGMESLGVLAGGYHSHAYGVSADGSVVVGYSEASDGLRAFRWTQATGMVSLGTLPGGSSSYAEGVSADGSVVVGESGSTDGTRAFRWTAQTEQMVSLGVLEGGSQSGAYGVNADGSVVVGYSGSTGGARAFRWTTQTEQMENLGVLTGGNASYANGVSADGSVVAGESNSTVGWRAFRWTQATGMESLGALNNGAYSRANGVTGDGRVIVGLTSTDPLGSELADRAFRWTERTGMQTVEDWLRDSGVAVSDSLVTYEANATNYDGSVVVGSLQSGTAFIARGASGLLTLEDVAVSLGATARSTAMALSAGSTALNGAHSRPLDRRVDAGQKTLWATGDFGADDHGARDGDFGLAEFGGGFHTGPVQLNIALGLTQASQAIDGGSKTDVSGSYALVEGLVPLAGANREGGWWTVLSAYYHSGDADLTRAYLNAGLLDFSTATPGVDTYGARLRLEWDKAATVLSTALSPYADVSYTKAELDAYSETGGGFPASFNAQEDEASELRLGVDAARPMGETMRLLAILEYTHRFEDESANTSGEIIGLFGFDLPGAELEQDWLRLGVGLDGRLLGGTGAVMVNATTEGEVPNVWLNAAWRKVF